MTLEGYGLGDWVSADTQVEDEVIPISINVDLPFIGQIVGFEHSPSLDTSYYPDFLQGIVRLRACTGEEARLPIHWLAPFGLTD